MKKLIVLFLLMSTFSCTSVKNYYGSDEVYAAVKSDRGENFATTFSIKSYELRYSIVCEFYDSTYFYLNGKWVLGNEFFTYYNLPYKGRKGQKEFEYEYYQNLLKYPYKKPKTND
jgi:hypothetical protein